MKSNELRIGNIVYFGIVKEPIALKKIDPESPTVLMAEPIPLTEDWLVKFGFVKHNQYFIENNFDYQIQANANGEFILFHEQLSSFYGKEVEYVHQLQNAFFALTGSELTVKEAVDR